jgi:hypothetical protein
MGLLVFRGGEQIEGAVLYPGSRPTVLKIRLRYAGFV